MADRKGERVIIKAGGMMGQRGTIRNTFSDQVCVELDDDLGRVLSYSVDDVDPIEGAQQMDISGMSPQAVDAFESLIDRVTALEQVNEAISQERDMYRRAISEELASITTRLANARIV